MLPSIESAISVKATRNSTVAKRLECNAHTVTGWFSGRTVIPKRTRKALETAIGAPVDWDAYEVEFQAEQDRRHAARHAPPLPPPTHSGSGAIDTAPPAPAPAPVAKPLDPQTRPATAPRRLTATPPAQMPQRPRPAPPIASGGFFGAMKRVLQDDGKGLFDE